MIVIFDVDGVLIDVTKSYHYSIKDTVEHFSGKISDLKELIDIKLSFAINNDWDASVAGILYKKSGKNLEEFKDIFKDYSKNIEDMYKFAKNYNINLPDYKEVIDYFESKYHIYRDKEELIIPHNILQKVREKSEIMGVITGRPFTDLDYSFKLFDLYKYFDYIITEDDIPDTHLRKPSSYPLKLFFSKYSYKEPVYYIGDTKADKQMVDNFNKEEIKNIIFILYQNQHNKDIQNDLKVEKPEDILEVIK